MRPPVSTINPKLNTRWGESKNKPVSFHPPATNDDGGYSKTDSHDVWTDRY